MSKDKEKQGPSDKGGNPKGGSKKSTIGDSSNCKDIEVLGKSDTASKKNRSGFTANVDGDGSYAPPEPCISFVSSLNDELALLILARIPRSDYQKLCLLNRRYRSLMRSGELYPIRKSIGIKEPSVLILASGEPHWWSYYPRSGARHNLPTLPSDPCFSSFDKESICAGTHLLVSGKEIGGSVIWRYELVLNQWFKGPLMISPRCLFASANCGSVAYVAGGIGSGPSAPGQKPEILNSAEKYDHEKKCWNPLPWMTCRRKLCSGCYMDNKFYVIGGQNEKGENLTCGEFYDLGRNTWVRITDMIKGAPSWSSRSPPLIAVANDNLYSLEASSNQLRVYLKKSNSWKDLGRAPVRADHSRGWGVAFKSLGDELLVIGTTSDTYTCRGMTICTCKPDLESDSLEWIVLVSNGDQWSSFIFNCSVMMA
ncbi:F-box/kelch-repeat protein [Iris pallida]|uniref:F-box/kelch-repeat protein n=1 Tax=Iris pallida TaxID=29817 RepID=A0AAX6GX52_IRIPA|nr:F-box/kelch-repeat protein [Iris pallida]